MRKPIIAGNWKMNKTPSEAREFSSEGLSKNSSLIYNCKISPDSSRVFRLAPLPLTLPR